MKRPTASSLAAGGAIVAVLLALGYCSVSIRSRQPVARPFSALRPDHQVKIDRFRFFSVREGRKILSLEAESFIIDKKRIGPFSIALARRARIVNGQLTVFMEPEGSGGGETSHPSQQAPSQKTGRRGNSLRFPDLLSDAVLKDFPVPLGRVTSVEVQPISVTIMDGDIPLTAITASFAEIRLNSRDVRFTGTVRVTAGRKILTTDELTFDPGSGILGTDHAYQMTTGTDTTGGTHLRTDILLEPVAARR